MVEFGTSSELLSGDGLASGHLLTGDARLEFLRKCVSALSARASRLSTYKDIFCFQNIFFGTSSAFRGWVRVRVFGLWFWSEGQKSKVTRD